MYDFLIRYLVKRTPKENYDFTNIESILIRPYNAIGDGVMITASLNRLKENFPNTRLGIVINEYNEKIFRKCPLIDEYIPFTPFSALKNRRKFQIYIDYPNFSSKGVIFRKLLSPDYIIQMRTKDIKKRYNIYNTHDYDFYCKGTETGRHMSDSILYTPLFSDKKCGDNYKYVLTPPESGSDPYTHKEGIKNVLLSIEGTHINRFIPCEALEGALKAYSHLPLKWTLLNTKRAYEFYERLKNIKGINIELAPKTDFEGFFSLVYFADIVYSIDTAAVHIACAFKKNLCAVYANHKENLKEAGPIIYDNMVLIYPEKVLPLADEYKFKAELLIEKGLPFLEKYS